MGSVWFCLVAIMLAGYVVLDGFDIGAGILHLWIARSDAERRMVVRSIGPVWGGNEVWLIAAGGTLYFAFPALYAAGFSGFYLPLMVVLWLLILRGISLEFRSHVDGHIWSAIWDATFRSPASSSPFFTEPHSATWSAEFRLTPPAISSSRCGQTFSPPAKQEFSIGTQSSSE
jgi:cytochrome d oxidase subunit CydB